MGLRFDRPTAGRQAVIRDIVSDPARDLPHPARSNPAISHVSTPCPGRTDMPHPLRLLPSPISHLPSSISDARPHPACRARHSA